MIELTSSADNMPFIVTSTTKRSIQDKRKFIRSHVMRRKNGKTLPSRPPSWIDGQRVTSMTTTKNEYILPGPIRIAGGFALANLSTELSPAIFESIYQLREGMSPPVIGTSSSQTDKSWFEPIWSDPACLHFTIFIAKACQDYLQGQKEYSKFALTHLVKALGLLRQRVAFGASEKSTSDSTIVVVVGLTMVAIALGDFEVSKMHLDGLHKMVILRGGITAFFQNKLLQTKILSADLGVSLSTGCKPLFFSRDISWHPYITSHGRTSTFGGQRLQVPMSASDLEHFLGGLDTRLRFIWDDLAEFVRAANIAAQCKLDIDIDLYREVMVSIHYRLLNLYFETSNVNETIRLALLTFSSALFLQRRSIQTRYAYLSERFKASLTNATCDTGPMPARLTLWLYITGAVSAFGEDEQAWFLPVLARTFRSMGCKSWNEVESLLKSVLWVDIPFGASAKRIVKVILDPIII
ncbi:hypothetical protein F4781DRAFT_316855 [Annulohypoxylon bovei var. microspora]|nr:hypothetical protein F4781DRAFT_316855 [Annulohypoxylon bovei var. microspora]